jgi:hypothetical protein
MSKSKNYHAFETLIVYRASLLTEDPGRAGLRLPGVPAAFRNWCFHSRARRDFSLVLLAQSITGERWDQKKLAFEISVSRNTLKQILTEALDLGIAELDENNCISITEHFFEIYKLSYINEWRLIDSESACLLSEAFDSLSTRTITLSVEEAIDKTLELSILSRAESVKQDRKLKVELHSRPKEMNLSSWVISNTFNRDLLLLLMSASISGDMIKISQIMRRLNVSRNSAKQSLFSGMDSGFVKKSTLGFCFTDEALSAYIVWHEEVFKSYSDELLSAFSIFHSQLARN